MRIASLAALFALSTGCAGLRPMLPTESADDFSPPPLMAAADEPWVVEDSWEPFPLPQEDPSFRQVIVEKAKKLLGLRSLRKVSRLVPDDCSGFVRLAYLAAGVELMGKGLLGDNAVTAIWRRALDAGALKEQEPKPGDLIFFENTYDRNRDGRRNDGLTHVAVVESVEPDGTVVFVHRGRRGVSRSRLNTDKPLEHADPDGQVVNDWLRPGSRKNRPRLTGELWRGYATAEAMPR